MTSATMKTGFYANDKQTFWVSPVGRYWMLIDDPNFKADSPCPTEVESFMVEILALEPLEDPSPELMALAAVVGAKEMGEEDRKSYANEFGEAPVVGQVGDWDATGWSEAWRSIGNNLDIPIEDYDTYNAARLAYLGSLFDSTDVA